MALIQQAVDYSLEPSATEKTATYQSSLAEIYWGITRESTLPPWGSPRRLHALMQLFYEPKNVLVVGALKGLITRISQTPWEITGPKSRTPYWQDVFQSGQRGLGFTALIGMLARNYTVLDPGAVLYLEGRGSPDKPLNSAVVGLESLSSARCYFTDDDSHPVWYLSKRTGKLHKIHASRVVRWIDTPTDDPAFNHLGLSAMSRASAVAQITSLLMQHQVTTLDDVPASGYAIYNGLGEPRVNKAKSDYVARRSKDRSDLVHNLIEFFSMDPTYKATIDVTPFSQLPQNFSLTEYMSMYVDLAALAIGVDPQDIRPLSSSALGSGAQSTILAAKGKMNAYGLMLSDLERLINTAVLPRNMEFKWKPRDQEQDESEARTAQYWSGIATSLMSQGVITAEQAQRLLANNVQAFQDLLLDETGQLRLPDNDPKETVAEDTTQLADAPPAPEEAPPPAQAEKTLESTQGQFESDIANLFLAAVQGQVTRQRFGIAARALIAKYGRRAYLDGLEAGGVDKVETSDEDLAEIASIAASQSIYVTNVGEAIYADNTVSEAEAAGKPQLWWNKSIMPFYQAGLESADKNGMYEWKLGQTEEHCSTCIRLNGQVHRLRNWVDRGWLPQSSKLECGGWRCDCRLDKTTRPVSGSY